MNVFHRLDEASAKIQASAVAIGNFDGVHLGHQALLGEMVTEARRRKVASVVLTFFPHPVEVLRPGTHLERLTTAAEKLKFLEKLGVDSVVVAPFDEALAALSPEAFFQKFLVEGLKARSLHVGFNFNFGKGRAGNIDTLRKLSGEQGIDVFEKTPFTKAGVKVDSTTIRNRILEGDVTGATELLGRPYRVEGQVQHGEHRGGTLGFPTANLHASYDKVLPKNGVYVTRVEWQKQFFRSVTNVGVKPTFQKGETPPKTVTIEVHILDFEAKLYDEFLQLDFLERIRDEKKFNSVEELKARITKDVKVARDFDEN